ncbi:uncharacterized protein LOC109857169 isoform X2 [Pseudomyrmex gracilis]|nr:uncharacterized protein LOC109857169 isoform X2 [Pseudomyrmex gracilis]
MQAIRNGNIESVKLLLEKKASVDEVTYLGMSVLGLAAAISKEMFEIVYNACPDALANAGSDDITPLCVAAMKNDKKLFFQLMDLGIPLGITNEYTRIMMRLSTEQEISALVEGHLSMDDYWNDISDNIQVMSDQDVVDKTEDPIFKIEKHKKRDLNLNLLSMPNESNKGLISPNLTYHTVPSPDIVCFTDIDLTKKANIFFQDKNLSKETSESDSQKCLATDEYKLKLLPINVKRSQSARSTDYDSKTLSSHDDPNNITLGFTPEFSPLKSPHVPPDVNEESVFGDSTPTPPRCKTPPKGMLLNWQQTKMIMILRCFGLSQHIPIFLEQEVDIDLFLALTDQDLIEIGIEYEGDRRALLEVIEECKRRKVY